MRLFLILLIAVPFLSACSEEKSKVLSSKSPEGEAVVKVSGQRVTMDPWTTTIIAEGYGNSESVTTEIYSGSLDQETVDFTWLNNNTVKVVFEQTDGTRRNIIVQIKPEGIMVKEQ